MLNQGYVYQDRVSAADTGRPVAEFYARRYGHTGAREWLTRIVDGRVRLNGRVATPDDCLRPGDRLEFHRPPWREPDVPDRFDILWADGGVLVVGKPAGLPVLPGGGFLEHTLLVKVRARYGAVCAPLHRLGRGTSGAILFTRTPAAARYLGPALATGRLVKTYLALAVGSAMPDTFTVDTPIGPQPHPILGTVHAAHPAGRPSRTLVAVVRRYPDAGCSLLRVVIPTGRPHQIRIHLAVAGCPLVGDPLYGPGGRPLPPPADGRRAALPGDGGYWLHAWRLRFPHPDSGAEVEVLCPPPAALDPEGERPTGGFPPGTSLPP